MTPAARGPATIAILVAIVLASAAIAGGGTRGTSNLAEIRGPVVGISAVPGEGDLDVVAVEIDASPDPARLILLGPPSMLEEAGFEVAEGDVLRIKVFVAERAGDPEAALRVLNLTRRTMVRLRTFHQDPLWDTSGRWEGTGMHGAGGPRDHTTPRAPERHREGGGAGGRS
jgi:hypothetical protein